MELPVLATKESRGSRTLDLLNDLRPELDGELRTSRHDRKLYATDASMYQVEPLGVAVPHHDGDVIRIFDFCRTHGIALLARGAGTSLAGQTVNEALVIDTSAWMTRIISVDEDARQAVVQPGVVLDDLNKAAREHGLRFGPEVSTSTHATLGGMIANCSAGLHSLIYGMTDEHVLKIDAALSDGRRLQFYEGASENDGDIFELTRRISDVVMPLADEIDTRYPKVRRNTGGYKLDVILDQLRRSTPGTYDKVNLARLLTGSEGTLGFTLQATLNLVPEPAFKGLAVVGFRTLDEAMDALVPLLETHPSAIELIDEKVTNQAIAHPLYSQYTKLLPQINGSPARTALYVEYFGQTQEEIDEALSLVLKNGSSGNIVTYTDTPSTTSLWTLRKVGLGLLGAIKTKRQAIGSLEDCCVRVEDLGQFRRDFEVVMSKHNTTASYYAHASVGLLHIRPMLDLDDVVDREAWSAMCEEIGEIVKGYGGSVSGEHGDGRSRAEMVQAFYGPKLHEAFGSIKNIFDPTFLMNPGMITGDLKMVADLRREPNGTPLPEAEVDTYFHYENENGFHQAVMQCNGNGLCRKDHGGTMCPSYRATRDERHVTRGRGNALRLAITGQFAEDGISPNFDDPETLETLDLCLSCKACRRECPSHVDIAKLKAEYYAQHYRSTGRIPFQKKFFARVRRMNKLGSRFHMLANLVASFPPVKWSTQSMLHLDKRRTIPKYCSSLHKWFDHRPLINTGQPVVVLYPDCFTVYNDAHIGKAAVEVLEAFGYRVVLPEIGCCGRTYFSTGMLEEAQRVVTDSVDKLRPVLEAHDPVAIVACEPSCASSLSQEWQELKTSVPSELMQQIGSITHTIEGFLESRWEQHPQQVSFKESLSDPLTIHAHCHQKDIGPATESLLGRCGYAGAALVDSGCCGMAGSFGYTKEHFEISMDVAELSLGQAIRQQPKGPLAAAGTSCRHQVEDAFGRTALHPIELIHQQLNRE
ncbi:MAG: FAD-linked oxidase C-terminal domain-containing protein [Phycisphaerales bacterium]|nr:FAD-linked oxidase C-terminal domain-containing protein [Phycisphaerales bacterium]